MAGINPFDVLMAQITETLRSIVREELAAVQMAAASQQPDEEDRLVGREEIARRLDLTPDTVSAKMGKGELIWTIDPISGQRKMKKSTLDQYIRDLPEYTGLLSARKEAVA